MKVGRFRLSHVLVPLSLSPFLSLFSVYHTTSVFNRLLLLCFVFVYEVSRCTFHLFSLFTLHTLSCLPICERAASVRPWEKFHFERSQ